MIKHFFTERRFLSKQKLKKTQKQFQGNKEAIKIWIYGITSRGNGKFFIKNKKSKMQFLTIQCKNIDLLYSKVQLRIFVLLP